MYHIREGIRSLLMSHDDIDVVGEAADGNWFFLIAMLCPVLDWSLRIACLYLPDPLPRLYNRAKGLPGLSSFAPGPPEKLRSALCPGICIISRVLSLHPTASITASVFISDISPGFIYARCFCEVSRVTKVLRLTSISGTLFTFSMNFSAYSGPVSLTEILYSETCMHALVQDTAQILVPVDKKYVRTPLSRADNAAAMPAGPPPTITSSRSRISPVLPDDLRPSASFCDIKYVDFPLLGGSFHEP